MPLSNSPLAYTDCRTYLDQALDAEKGIRITCDTPGQAINLRQRLYKARQLDQKANLDIYAQGDPLYGRSVYDRLVAAVDGCTVILRKVDSADLKVEEL